MSLQSNSKIQSVVLVASVAILALVLGVLLDGKVIPDAGRSLLSEEPVAINNDKSDVAESITSQTPDIEAAEQRKEQRTSQLKELDAQSKATLEKANGLTKHAEQLISKAGLKQSAGDSALPNDNEEIAKRLADVRSRLDAIKK